MPVIPTRRRRRPRVICNRCRLKKIKCDLGHPCANCHRSGVSCQYSEAEQAASTQRTIKGQMLDNQGYPSEAFKLLETLVSLRAEVKNLKSQKQERKIKDLLDQPRPQLKCTLLSFKPSKTNYVGAMCRYTLIFSKPCFVYISMAFTKALSEAREAYKKEFVYPRRKLIRDFLNTRTRTEQDVADIITNELFPHKLAIQERLSYFQRELNQLLYQGFVPMQSVLYLFMHYFPEGESEFTKPKKVFYYLDLALICAIVYLVEIFTVFNGDAAMFDYGPPLPNGRMSALVFRLLNLGCFQTKVTQQGLLAMVVLRSAMYMHSNFERGCVEFDSYPWLQLILHHSMRMGFHLDIGTETEPVFKKQNEVELRNMTSSQRKLFWNWMLAQDMLAASTGGTPLLINLDYCHGPYESELEWNTLKWNTHIERMRDVCLLMNSQKPISINDVMARMESVLLDLKELRGQKFDRISLPIVRLLVSSDNLTHRTEKKFHLLMAYIALGSNAASALGYMVKEYPGEEKIAVLAGRCYHRVLLAAYLALSQVKDVLDGDKHIPTNKTATYVAYLKECINVLFGQGWLLLYGGVLSQLATKYGLRKEISGEAGEYEYILIDHGIIDPSEKYKGPITAELLEDTFINGDDKRCQRLVNRLLEPTELNHFSSKLYALAHSYGCLRESGDTYTCFKIAVMLMVIVDTFGTYDEDLKSGAVSIRDIMNASITELYKKYRDWTSPNSQLRLNSILATTLPTNPPIPMVVPANGFAQSHNPITLAKTTTSGSSDHAPLGLAPPDTDLSEDFLDFGWDDDGEIAFSKNVNGRWEFGKSL